MRATVRLRHPVALLATAMVIAPAGCVGGEPSADGGRGTPHRGGTLTLLTQADHLANLDPQLIYIGDDAAFASAYLHRSLLAYRPSPDPREANDLVPDLATDTGTPSDGAKTWSFTLKDGPTFEDGSPITCRDVKYGVSRTFATDVLVGGPGYAISMLDIPKDADGTSVFKGPYATEDNDRAAFDKAVGCSADDRTITFHLARAVGDFNYTVTLLAFGPVPEAADTAEKYDAAPVTSGPYRIEESTKGEELVLVRNESWDATTDGFRGAYPDKVVVKFGLDTSVIDGRLLADHGADQSTIPFGPLNPIQPASLSKVFGSKEFATRRVNGFDPYVLYLAIDTVKVPDLKHRMAMAAALDRAQLRTLSGGRFAGDLADGVIKPTLLTDYAPSGMWDGLLGQRIPDTGDADYAKSLIRESGRPIPTIRFDYPQSPTEDNFAAAVVASLGDAGITVRPNPIAQSQYGAIAFDPTKNGHLLWSGWGADWANASTVIPELFTPSGSFNVSRVDDAAFNSRVAQAMAETDRDRQAELWKELNKEAMRNVWVIPHRFGRTQRLAGSSVRSASGDDHQVYLWAPFGSWPYADLYLDQ